MYQELGQFGEVLFGEDKAIYDLRFTIDDLGLDRRNEKNKDEEDRREWR